MKKNHLSLWGLALVVLITAFSSCDSIDGIVDEEDAVELLENALSSKSGGFSQQLKDLAYMAENYSDACNQTFDSTITKSNGLGSIVTFDYLYNWQWTVGCDNANVPQQIDFSYTSEGDYTAPRMSSDDDSNFDFVATGLQPSESAYSLSGTYVRSGAQTVKIRDEVSISSALTITSPNLSLDKSTKEVSAGAATFTLTGSTSGGNTFSFGGDILYNGDETVTVTLEGKSYTFDL